MTRALALLAFALGAVGCGGDADDSAPADPAPATSLELTLWPEGIGVGEAARYTLECDPPGGDHPDPQAACAALAQLGVDAFAPVPDDVLCTQVYGGPQEAEVTGIVRGERVQARLAYNDGCEIERWDRLERVVPRPAS